MFKVPANMALTRDVRVQRHTKVANGDKTDTEASIVTTLYRDPDYEVINYAYTLFERYANSIDPCDKSRAHLAGFFLKMMKQFSNRNVRWMTFD